MTRGTAGFRETEGKKVGESKRWVTAQVVAGGETWA